MATQVHGCLVNDTQPRPHFLCLRVDSRTLITNPQTPLCGCAEWRILMTCRKINDKDIAAACSGESSNQHCWSPVPIVTRNNSELVLRAMDSEWSNGEIKLTVSQTRFERNWNEASAGRQDPACETTQFFENTTWASYLDMLIKNYTLALCVAWFDTLAKSVTVDQLLLDSITSNNCQVIWNRCNGLVISRKQ